MRAFSSLASRASPVIQQTSQKHQNNQIRKPSKVKSSTPLGQNPSPNTANQQGTSPGNKNSIFSTSISANKHKLTVNQTDHHYFTKILSRKDWFLLLNHELKAKRIILNQQFVVSILQNQENPLHHLRFYVWVSNISPLYAKNQSVRVVLSNSLYRKGPILLSADLIQDVRNAGCKVTEDLLCILMGSWGRLGLAKYCAEVFEQISYLGLNPSTRLYNAVIDGVVKSNSLDLAYLKFQQMQVDNCVPDRFTYNILIHGVCKVGVMEEALRLVKQMEGLDLSPNVYTYSILIDGFCKAKRVPEAFKLLEKMKERDVSPNEATFRSLVNGVFRCLSPHEAFQLLSRWVEREPVLPKVVYDTILLCLCDSNLPTEAASFLRTSKAKGFFPDSTTFNITMACLIKGLELEDTCHAIDSFIQQGGRVSFNAYLALVESLYRSGREDRGNYYMEQMFQGGIVTNVFSYNMVIDCFCKAKMINKAAEIFGLMYQRGISPNLVTFNTLISGHCKAGEIGKARELLLMLLEHGFTPDVFTFSSIIDGLCRVNHIKDAFDSFTEMMEWGITPNSVTYNILIRSLCITGDVAKSVSLLRKMKIDGIEPDVFSFNALIQSYCRKNKVEKAQRLLISMLTLDLRPDNFTYSAFIKALCGLGRFDEAKELFRCMEENGCPPDAYTCNAYIDALVASAHFEAAQDIFKQFKEKGLQLKPIT